MTTVSNCTPVSPDAPSAIIVGGGVIGAAIAYELGKAGFACTLLDKGGWSQEASTAAAGMLARRWKSISRDHSTSCAAPASSCTAPGPKNWKR